MARRKKSNAKSGRSGETTVEEVISASDIERYGYCPLNWWQKHQGTEEKGKYLEDGTIQHAKIAKDLESITEKETIATRSQMGILLFALVAILLGANGVAIIYFKYISNIHEVAFSYVLLIISILWIALAIIMFVYTLIKDYQNKRRDKEDARKAAEAERKAEKAIIAAPASAGLSQSPAESTSESGVAAEAEPAKRTILTRKTVAQWFITVAITLALSGYMLEYPFAPPEVLSRILLAGALVWLLGTSIALFFALRLEEKIKKLESVEDKEMDKKIQVTRSHSEMLILLFATGAAILGIAGFIVKYELAFEPLDIFGQIFIILSLVWMSAGFLFFYRSLWGGVIVRSAMREISSEISAKKI
jgi:uncharacterized membrane protein YciS (DUF1049 family)